MVLTTESHQTFEAVLEGLKVNQGLRQLSLHINVECGAHYWMIFADFLQRNERVISLYLAATRCGGFPYILEAVRQNQSLKRLQLGGMFPTVEPVLWKRLLIDNTCLEELDLRYFQRFSDDWTAIAEGLRYNRTLKRLVLGHNRMRIDPELWGSAVKYNATIEEISFEACNVVDFNLGQLCEGLVTASNLENLNLSCNHLSSDGFYEVITLAAMSNSLKVLDLSYNDLTSPDDLSDLLVVSRSLSKLTLDHNERLAKSLNSSELLLALSKQSLRELSMVNTGITGAGSLLIWESLRLNTKLETLQLDDNTITFDSYPASLCLMLRENNSLRLLSLRGNTGFGPHGLKALFEGLADNRGMRMLELSGIQFCEDSLHTFDRALGSNACLREVYLPPFEASPAWEEGLESLIASLATANDLRRIDFADRLMLGPSLAQSLLDSLANNLSLRSINVQYELVPERIQDSISLHLLMNRQGLALFEHHTSGVTMAGCYH